MSFKSNIIYVFSLLSLVVLPFVLHGSVQQNIFLLAPQPSTSHLTEIKQQLNDIVQKELQISFSQFCFYLDLCWCFIIHQTVCSDNKRGPTLNFKVGGLPVSAPMVVPADSDCIGLFYQGELCDYEASCFCRATGLRVLAIFSVTSLCFAKEHREDKGRGLISVCPTVGKARAQELVQETQDDD